MLHSAVKAAGGIEEVYKAVQMFVSAIVKPVTVTDVAREFIESRKKAGVTPNHLTNSNHRGKSLLPALRGEEMP
jgi:hypothetical protein